MLYIIIMVHKTSINYRTIKHSNPREGGMPLLTLDKVPHSIEHFSAQMQPWARTIFIDILFCISKQTDKKFVILLVEFVESFPSIF